MWQPATGKYSLSFTYFINHLTIWSCVLSSHQVWPRREGVMSCIQDVYCFVFLPDPQYKILNCWWTASCTMRTVCNLNVCKVIWTICQLIFFLIEAIWVKLFFSWLMLKKIVMPVINIVFILFLSFRPSISLCWWLFRHLHLVSWEYFQYKNQTEFRFYYLRVVWNVMDSDSKFASI